MKNISPFAPSSYKITPKIKGVKISVINCGLKKNQKNDLVLIKLDKPSNIFGLFTNSHAPGEPIKWNRKIIKFGKISALIINSGNANVFTGDKGQIAIEKIVNELSKELGVSKKEIYVASTGIIGEQLDYRKILNKIKILNNNLNENSINWFNAADAIRTTDTFPKLDFRKITINKKKVIINGIAKGSGMIAPNMATMLSFIFSNVDIKNNQYFPKFKNAVDDTFNSITVDSDTSTSDMVLFICVNDKNSVKIKKKESNLFFEELQKLMKNLALQIVKDGEGASKFIEVEVKGCKKKTIAKEIALSVANSPLVKTAISGENANWGRIIMAIGKVKSKIDLTEISLSFGINKIIDLGKVIKTLNEKKIQKYLKSKEIKIIIDLNKGNAKSIIWTCDYTKDYININANYKT